MLGGNQTIENYDVCTVHVHCSKVHPLGDTYGEESPHTDFPQPLHKILPPSSVILAKVIPIISRYTD